MPGVDAIATSAMDAILQCLDEFKHFVRMAFGADAVERMAQGAFFVDNESRAQAVHFLQAIFFFFLPYAV